MTMTDSNTMFCDFDDDSLVLFSSDDEKSDSHYESKQYENFTSMLKGVPPPSSITIPKFTVEEMLQKYKDNVAFFGFDVELGSTKPSSSKNPVPFLNYANSSLISENIASVAQKVQERYVQMETMSSCNIWLRATLERCVTDKKRLRMGQGVGLSPGRRLSHLARRRQFFSSANLQRLASSESIRQIEIRKNTNGGNARKKMTRTVESEKLKSSKRALFMSPEHGTPTKYGNTAGIDRKMNSPGSEERKRVPLQEKSKKEEVLRWLSQQKFEMRRRLTEAESYPVEWKRKCPRRSLNFADDDASSTVATSESNNSTDKKTSSSGKLSEIHKNKLLWAISVVLRENNITRNNENFKSLAAKLFFTCRTNLDEILSMNTGEGTSDKILCFARKIIPSVFEELGIELPSEHKSEKNNMNNESQINGDLRDESKENINKNNVDNRNHPSNCQGGEAEFVFKTPNKLRKKRIVKSCQKAPNSGNKKKNVMRRWRSLELLIEDAVLSSMEDLKNTNQEKPLEEGSNAHANETAQSTAVNDDIPNENDPNTSDLFANGDRVSSPTNIIPSLPFVDRSVVFSPIPSSVKEESENILYPSLGIQETNVEESEVVSDEHSSSQGTDESMELPNQDAELESKIKSLEKGGMFTQEYLLKYGGGEDSIPDVEHPQTVEKTECCLASDGNTNIGVPVGSDTQCTETNTEESSVLTENSQNNESKIKEDEEENGLKCEEDGKNEAWEPLTPECISKVEKGTYKPRKLVVKKSKPNWKVVRENSDEAENESELRLKMRLSHEWEIVARNSSCSDIGNNSECETSMNCSQVSSTSEKEVNSDEEAEEPIQSKCDESMDEGTTKSNLVSENNVKPQFDESDENFNANLSIRENGLSEHDETMQETPIQGVTQSNNTIEVDNCFTREEFSEKTVGDDKLNTGEGDSNVEHETIVPEEGDCENEDEQVNNFGTNMNCTNINTEQMSEKQPSEEEMTLESSQILSEEEESQKGEEMGISPETKAKDEDYSVCKRRREWEGAHDDSESGNSSPSNGPERKKKLLSLENYKARKLEEASNNVKLISKEETDSKDVSSDEKSSGSNTTKKIYNIRLKHPIGHHKRKHKHKKYEKERRERHRSRGSDLDISDNADSGSHLNSLEQFLGSFYGKNPSEKVDLTNHNTQNGHTTGLPSSNSKEVNIQTIIDALSTLSNLVEEKIKIENNTMTTQKDSGDGKKNNWLDVVSSWCGNNLNYFKLMSNTSSLSGFQGFDDGSRAAMNKIESQHCDLTNPKSNIEHSVTSNNGIVNKIDLLIMNSLKTEHNVIQDCVGSTSQQTTDATRCTNPALVNTNMGLPQNSVISNSIGLSNNPVNFPNYAMYSNSQCIGSQNNVNALNYSVPFSAFSGVTAPDLKGWSENIGYSNSEREIPVENQQHTPKRTLKDPRCNPDSSSKRQHHVDSRSSDYTGTLTSAFPSNTEYSMQTPYQYSNNFVNAQKQLYQPNAYCNYQNWQSHSDVNSWNYHQNTMSEGYQNTGFYPFHMPYYMNKY